MAGFDGAKAREALAIPEDFEPVAMIAVGRPGDPSALAEDLAAREAAPRSRRPLAEVAFDGTFGAPLAL
jgi:hypothetical protein